jgi:ankyrin repeat protein
MKHVHLLLPAIGLSLMFGCSRNPAEKPAPPPISSVQPAEAPSQAKAVEPPPKTKTKNLAEAVTVGNVNDVKIFLQRDPEAIHRPGANDMLPIQLAADYGHSEVIQLLLQAGADVNAPHVKVQATPLQYAAEAGHLDAVRTLLAANAKVDAVDSQGRTPLMWAISNGQVPVIQELLQHGAKVDGVNSQGLTPLMLAASKGQVPVIQELLQHGANANLRTPTGWTALKYAQKQGNPQAVELLGGKK